MDRILEISQSCSSCPEALWVLRTASEDLVQKGTGGNGGNEERRAKDEGRTGAAVSR
jgi:hypothetical protein